MTLGVKNVLRVLEPGREVEGFSDFVEVDSFTARRVQSTEIECKMAFNE